MMTQLSLAQASEFPELKTPEESVREIFNPFWNFATQLTTVAKNLFLKVYRVLIVSLIWTFDQIKPIFETANIWFESATGLTINETLEWTANIFTNIIESFINFFRELWQEASTPEPI